jgi:hypothetical protein
MKFLLSCAVLFVNVGCLPLRMVGNADRHNWAEINLEREKAGLKPLTWNEYHYPMHYSH